MQEQELDYFTPQDQIRCSSMTANTIIPARRMSCKGEGSGIDDQLTTFRPLHPISSVTFLLSS